MQHEGMGVARRAAEHVRLRTEREAQEAQIEQPDEAERVEVAAEQVQHDLPLLHLVVLGYPMHNGATHRDGHS